MSFFFFFGPRIFSIFKIWKLYYRRRSSVIEFCDSYCNFLDNSYNYSTKESELCGDLMIRNNIKS